MPQIDLIDQTWIVAPRDRVAAAVGDEDSWYRWWPDLVLEVCERRGPEGVRWLVHPSAASPYVGSMEVWLQERYEGVVLHYFLRLDPADGRTLRAREVDRRRREHARHAKQVFWALKDRLEQGCEERVDDAHG